MRPARRTPADVPFLGVGVGLRPVHYGEILARPDARALGTDWFEAISENYMVRGGRPLRMIETVRSHFPIALHGVSLNIGSADALDKAHLDHLCALVDRIEPAWISDHLCWSGVGGHALHDLLPLPLTEKALAHVVERVRRVQDHLGRRIALENASTYAAFACDEMREEEFLARIAVEADCGILLDVNNVFVSAHNHGFDPRRYLDWIPAERVVEIHLAGPSVEGELLIDTHDHPVREEVWDLYAHTIRRLGPVSTLIEWDEAIPPLARVAEEAARARRILENAAETE